MFVERSDILRLVNNIRYYNDINFANMDPTNIGQHVELSYVQKSSSTEPFIGSKLNICRYNVAIAN